MQREDIDKINENCDKLPPAIDWPKMVPKLIEHEIYKENDIIVERWQQQQRKNPDSPANNRNIYLGITKRGPRAFQAFIDCLREVGREDLISILSPHNSNSQDLQPTKGVNESNSVEKVTVPKLEERESNVNSQNIKNQPPNDFDDYFWTRLQTATEPLKIHVKKLTGIRSPSNSKLSHYRMNTNPRGLVLIINNVKFVADEERSGAEHDEKNLKELYEQMGFKVLEPICNATCEEMENKILEFTKMPELSSVASTFVIIMSHGSEEHVNGGRGQSVVWGVDNRYLKVKDILEKFTATNCPDMNTKPKIFVFQSCRGEKEQHSLNKEKTVIDRSAFDFNNLKSQEQPEPTSDSRNHSDMIVAHATLPSHKALRDKKVGSWYIQILCEVFMNHAYDTELVRLFQMVDCRLSTLRTEKCKCQTSVTMNHGFNKKCYLNPGLNFEDSAQGNV